MKKIITTTFAVSALIAGISSSAYAEGGHAYLGAGAGYFNSDGKRDLGDASVLTGQLGYYFDDDWSVEGSYGSANGSMSPKGRHLDVTSLTAAYRLAGGDTTQLLGLVGAQYTHTSVPTSMNNNTTQMTLGLGVSHYLTDTVELRGVVTAGHTNQIQATDLYTTLAVNYHFGRKSTPEPIVEPVAAPAPVQPEPVVLMQKTLHANFATDSHRLTSTDIREVNEVSASMRSNPGSQATLVGHTDSTGSAAYNQKLSVKRAQAVADQMVADGVDANAIQASGVGASQPVATNSTAAGRAENRRVEAVVTGIAK